MYILFSILCAKDQIKNRTPKMLNSRFKFICYSYLDSCLNFKTPITQHSKITCFASWRKPEPDNSKSRYGNDLIFVMVFLDNYVAL